MKIGINTFIWTANFDRSHLDLLPRIKAGGFDGVEVGVFDFSTFPAAELRRSAEANGLGVTMCTALTGKQSIATEDDEVRNASIGFLEQAIRAAADAGVQVLAGPFCSAVGYLPGRRRTNEEWKRAVDALQQLGRTLDECQITMAVEPLNRFETFFLNTAADAVRLCDEVNHPRIGVLFDTFHANIEEKDLPAAYRSIGKRLRHVHSCENDRGTPGSGHIDWPGVFAALRDIGYDGWLVIESFGFAIKEIAAAACIWRDLAASPESIAFEGVKFLRKQADAVSNVRSRSV
jgi:D-psicose/D-tagatose/L-ribulose 3-epimerase